MKDSMHPMAELVRVEDIEYYPGGRFYKVWHYKRISDKDYSAWRNMWPVNGNRSFLWSICTITKDDLDPYLPSKRMSAGQLKAGIKKYIEDNNL